MEPRWRENGFSTIVSFVGSCDRFDLWSSERKYLWVVWGSTVYDWTTYCIIDGRLDRKAVHKESGNPTGEELDLIEHYMFLFVPAVGLKVSKLANVGV